MGKKEDTTFQVVEKINSIPSDDRSLETITKICEKNGVTLDTLVSKLEKLTNAKKVTLDKCGEEHEEEDNATQHKATMSLLELLCYLKNGPIVSVDVKISAEEREIIDMYGRWSDN